MLALQCCPVFVQWLCRGGRLPFLPPFEALGAKLVLKLSPGLKGDLQMALAIQSGTATMSSPLSVSCGPCIYSFSRHRCALSGRQARPCPPRSYRATSSASLLQEACLDYAMPGNAPISLAMSRLSMSTSAGLGLACWSPVPGSG